MADLDEIRRALKELVERVEDLETRVFDAEASAGEYFADAKAALARTQQLEGAGAAERAAVVAWLRSKSTPDPLENNGDIWAQTYGYAADAIEAGAHLKGAG